MLRYDQLEVNSRVLEKKSTKHGSGKQTFSRAGYVQPQSPSRLYAQLHDVRDGRFDVVQRRPDSCVKLLPRFRQTHMPCCPIRERHTEAFFHVAQRLAYRRSANAETPPCSTETFLFRHCDKDGNRIKLFDHCEVELITVTTSVK
jgi:hypothetical protein